MIDGKKVIDDMTAAQNVPFCGQLNNGGHQLVVRVYYADTDFSGVVYHARYLDFFERGRTEFLRLCGIHHHELASGGKLANQGETDSQHNGTVGQPAAEKLAWVVAHMDIRFARSAGIDDVLEVQTRMLNISGARALMQQAIYCQDMLITEAQVQVVLINALGKPRRFPKAWSDRLLAC